MNSTSTFLIWSNEHHAWWKPNEKGYTVEVAEAGVYSFDDAVRICTGSNISLKEDDIPSEAMVPVVPTVLQAS